MANTYTQIHIQFIFAVKYRKGVILASWKDELYKYLTGIVQNNKHKMISINGMPDHIHLLAGIRPSQSISDLMKDLKGSSSKWINEKKFTKERFEWQEGYGAFSYGKSQVKNVISYIENQEKHHKRKSFKEEYLDFLKKFDVEFDDKYLFKDLI
ncbi:MAG: IS200/IS605 family transposase [Ignavibacteria bacterium]|nr:IS200/IS605 family transposase [Ignavibacteria bacterium]